jgi:uncharacterized protein YqjF (DUF2071 family)
MQTAPTDNTWAMRQTWSKLLFAHWPVKPEVLRPLIPSGLILDTFDGMAWVGVVPFYMSNVHFHYMPPFPTTAEFCEMNVRTYVLPKGGKPGVWFFSLDAASILAVIGARIAFHLPYYHADMHLKSTEDTVHYTSRRKNRGAQPAEFEGHYQPTGAVYHSQAGTLDHWLTERYCLYAADSHKNIYQADITHDPWPLQPASADIVLNTVAQASGIALPDTQPLLHYAERQDVYAWFLRRISVS